MPFLFMIFFQESFVLSPPTECGSLCVLLSTKCKIQSTLGLTQVSKHFLAYFSVIKAFPKKLLQLSFIIFILSERSCCPKFQFCTVKSSWWAPLLLYYINCEECYQFKLVNTHYHATPVLSTGGKQDCKDIRGFSSIPHTLAFLNSQQWYFLLAIFITEKILFTSAEQTNKQNSFHVQQPKPLSINILTLFLHASSGQWNKIFCLWAWLAAPFSLAVVTASLLLIFHIHPHFQDNFSPTFTGHWY